MPNLWNTQKSILFFLLCFETHSDSSALGLTPSQLWLEHPCAQVGIPTNNEEQPGLSFHASPKHMEYVQNTSSFWCGEEDRDTVKSFKRNDN